MKKEKGSCETDYVMRTDSQAQSKLPVEAHWT